MCDHGQQRFLEKKMIDGTTPKLKLSTGKYTIKKMKLLGTA